MRKPSTINSINSNPFVNSVRKRCVLRINVFVRLLALWSILFTIQSTPIQAQQVFASGNKNTPAEKPTESIKKTKDFLLKGNVRYNGHNLDQAMEFAIEARKYCDYFKSLNLAGVIQADLHNPSTSKSLLLKAKDLGEDEGNNLDTIYFNLAGVEMLKKDFTSILFWLSKINNTESFTKFLYYRGVARYQTGNIQEATNDLVAGLETDPRNADIYFHLGLILYETRNFVEALPFFRRAVKLTAEATPYQIALANVLEKLNRNRESLNHFTIAHNQEPENLEALLGIANLQCKLGNYQTSLKLFQKVLEQDRNSPDAYYGMGNVFYAQKQYDDATQNYSRSVKLNPNFAPAYVGRANISCHMGDYESAIDDYSFCIYLDPSNTQAYEGRAIAYFRTFNYYSAITDFDQCMVLNKEYPFSYDAYISKGFADYNTGNYEEALQCFQKAIFMKPKKATGYDGLGCVYYALEKFELSVSNFTIAIKLAPDNDVLYTNRGNALYRIMSYDKALEDYNTAVEINPKNEQAYNGRGICLHQFEKYTEAIHAFDQGIELVPFNYDLHRNMGISRGLYVKELRDSGRLDEARLQYDLMLLDHARSIDFNLDSTGYLINLGYLHMVFGEYDIAMDYLNKVTNPNALMFTENNKGVVLAMRDNGKNLFQAYEHFDKAVTTDIDQKYPNPRVNRALIGQELGRLITGDQQAADFISSNNFIKILHKDKYYSTYFYYALMRYCPPPTEHGFENEVITEMPEFAESNIDYLVYESDNECFAPITPKHKTLNLRNPKKNKSNLAFCPRNF
jgi:tetratricopeptide (TPR) repeat protein